jgi:hypothetical protein
VKFEVLGEGQVRLAWPEVKGADRYLILSAGRSGGPYELLAEAKELDHTLTGLEPGTTLYLVVRAAQGETESKDSPEVEIPVK